MTSKELNLKLIESFPEIKDVYCEETSWQDGDETGSHIIYEDVFVPFIREQLLKGDTEVIKKIFTFIEEILLMNSAYSNEVISFSVLEPLIFDKYINQAQFEKSLGKHAAITVEQIKEFYGVNRDD